MHFTAKKNIKYLKNARSESWKQKKVKVENGSEDECKKWNRSKVSK